MNRNNPDKNRFRVALGTATVTTGMRKIDADITKNKYVAGGDRGPSLWPCKKDHPPHRIARIGKRLYCRECQLEDAHRRRAIS